MKRTRLVDILLMVGLFVVGAAILWTLFTLGNDRSRPAELDAATPPPDEAPADPDAVGDVEVVPPDGTGAARPSSAEPAAEPAGEETGAAAGDATPEQEAAADGDANRTDAAEGADGANARTAPEPAPTEPIVAGEPVPLGRVGFSFATGTPGACGIPLEPWEHVAVSRDVLASYGCGTEIVIELGDEIAGRTRATLVVADTMNEQFTRTANIYVDPDEPAFEYGVTDGTLIP